MAESTKVRLWQSREKGGAIEFATTKPAPVMSSVLVGCVFVWIPTSLIEHISRFRNADCPLPECIVTLPAWKARAMGLKEID